MRGVAQPTFRRIKQFLAVVGSGQTLPLKNSTLKAFHDRFKGPQFDPRCVFYLLLEAFESNGTVALLSFGPNGFELTS